MSDKIIFRIDNFLNSKECNYVIKDFNDNFEQTKIYRNTRILRVMYKPVCDKLNSLFKFYNFSNPYNMEIVLWDKKSKMDFHLDKVGNKFAFIIYLNDEYNGGETIIDNIKIKPKTGRIVLFSNGFYLHKVNEIKNKKRYTLIGWYK
tara:strand:- start:106 stop:546 length:441 start_codon:yes stop_codon:yes gene_type:complete